MKRATIALGIFVILASSCTGNRLSAPLAATLQDHVAQIRSFVEHGRPGLARSELRQLVELVTTTLEAGRIDEGRATEILQAAQLVADRLALVPRITPTESPSPTPVDEGGDGEQGNGHDKDKGKGHGDDDHGNDN